MGCNCSNLLGIKEDGDIENDNKINNDFFIDYGIEEIKNSPEKYQNNDNLDINLEDELFGFISSSNNSTNKKPLLNFSNRNLKTKPIENNNDRYNKDITINKKERYLNNCLYKSKTNRNDKININSNSNSNKILYVSKIDVNYSIDTNNKIDLNDFNSIPEDNYSCILFDYINKLRTDPKSISNLIKNSEKYIMIDENNEVFFKKNKIKISLNKGIAAFEETVNLLNDINPMNKIIFNKNIVIELPKDEKEIQNMEFLQKKIDEIQNNGNNIISYWREKISDPEITFIIMTVDDNQIETGLKRKDLLNPNVKYIGISSININKHFACYITLSK